MVKLLIAVLLLIGARTAPTLAAEGEREAWLEVSIERPADGPLPYQGEMILATVTGYYHDFRIGKETLYNPSMASFDWTQLGRDSWSDAVVDGVGYTVVTRKMALFPRTSGSVTIEPFVHHLTLIGPDGAWFKRDIKSAPVTLEVRPPPVDPSRAWWLPAKALTFSDSWTVPPETLKDSQTTIRTVTITALGANPQTLPPAPSMREKWLITFTEPEIRTVRPTEEGPETTVVWTWRLRPITGEPGVLPEVRIPWFDTTDHIAKEIVLAAAPIGQIGFGDGSSSQWPSAFRHADHLVLALLLGFILGSTVLWWDRLSPLVHAIGHGIGARGK